MFATLLGALPRPPVPPDADEGALVDAAIAAQTEAGLEPVTDGGWWGDRPPVDAWLETSRRTDRIVKQAVVGPLSAASPGLEEARALNVMVRALADAGCPFIEIQEPNLATIGDDPAGWARVRELHAVLTEGVADTHLSLAVTGGAIHPAGFEAVLAAPFASYALDLISGPENWRFVRAVPGDRGIICGAMPTAATDEGPETLLWAAAYAASSDGRGRDRVGLATASSLADLPWDVAIRKLHGLGAAVELAGRSPDELRAGLDPRSIDARTAALGHGAPPRRRGS